MTKTKSFLFFVASLLLLYVDALCTRGPGPIITALNQSCVRFVGETTTVDHCAPKGETGQSPPVVQVNSSCVTVGGILQCGYPGPQGATGATGPTGPAPSVLQLNDRCATITGVGNAVVCAPALPAITPVNSSCLSFGGMNICGPTGATGPAPTVTVVNSSCVAIGGITICAPTGATGATGATGPAYVPPRTTVVDGTTYALTVAGVSAAITARWFAGGGVVSLTGDIIVSETPIYLRSKTTLDCNGYTIKAHPTAAIYSDGMVRTLGVDTGGPYNILANATRGMKNISFSPTDILNFLPGDHMNIRKCRMPDYPQNEADYHTFLVFAVDYAAGIVTLRNPLPFDCLVAGTVYVPTASRFVPITDAGIRNCVFDANGNNATGFHLLTARNARNYRADNLRFTGYLPPDGMAFYSLDSVDCAYTNFDTRNLQVQGGVRDIGFEACESCLVENIRSNGAGGFGPHILRWHDGVVQNVWSLQNAVRNFRVDSSYRCILRNVFTLNGWLEGSGTGLFVAFGSSYNVVDGLISVGNVGRGLSFAYEGDAKNQITNYVAYSNGGGDISAGVDTANNYVHGNYGLDAISGSDISYRNHLERVCGLNGLVAAEVKGPPFAKSTDLRPYEVTTTRANDTHLIETYRGADGFVRVFVKRFL